MAKFKGAAAFRRWYQDQEIGCVGAIGVVKYPQAVTDLIERGHIDRFSEKGETRVVLECFTKFVSMRQKLINRMRSKR